LDRGRSNRFRAQGDPEQTSFDLLGSPMVGIISKLVESAMALQLGLRRHFWKLPRRKEVFYE
jgi:hypothetical protein